MPDGPFGVVAWWQVSLMATALNSLACFGFVLYIGARLARRHELRIQLALATMLCVFALGLPGAVQVLFQIGHSTGPDAERFAAQQRNEWWLALPQLLVSVVAAYFFLNRRSYGRVLAKAFLISASPEQQREAAREAALKVQLPEEDAEDDRDFYANMMKALNRNSPTLVQAKDLDGRYLMVNAAFERTFQVRAKDIVGRTATVIDPTQATESRANDLRAQSGAYRSQETVQAPDGVRHLDTVRFPVFSREGVLQGTASISLDVTELRGNITDLSAARDTAVAGEDAALAAGLAKSEFLATMSHEIRTPMNAVIGMTELLLQSELNAQQRELLSIVETSGNSLLVLIDDILDLSKIEAGKLSIVVAPFDLRTMIEECADLVGVAASTKRLDLVVYVDDNCPQQVLGDALRIRQICINLLSNAVKFTTTGEVLVSVSTTPTSHGLHELAIEVADTGIGITADEIEQLFRPFAQVDTSPTRAYGGTGLGLVISRRLARAMGGDITVASRPGSGSAFTATAVVDTVNNGDIVPDLNRNALQLAGARVLLVDDNPTNLRIVELQLEDMGLRCTSFQSSLQALDAVERGRRFDLAVLDVNMPHLGGIELANTFSTMTPALNMPIVLVTSAIDSLARTSTADALILLTPIKKAELTLALVAAIRTRALPLTPAAPTTLAVPEDESLRVLLAEDNLVNQRVAQLMLASLGHAVDTVDDGAAACTALQENPYDVVLMDINMPVLNGLDATRRIRTDVPYNNQPYIIALTADATNENRIACLAAGMDDHLNKPVHIQQLKTSLNRTRGQCHL